MIFELLNKLWGNLELGIGSYKSKMFYLSYCLPSFLSRFQFAENFKLPVLLWSFVPPPYFSWLHKRWFVEAQDLSKEQLSHFSAAQIVGFCFSHSALFLKGTFFFPTVNGTQTPGSWSSFLCLECTLLRCVWNMQKSLPFQLQDEQEAPNLSQTTMIARNRDIT